MFLARVTGDVVATVKHPHLRATKLLLLFAFAIIAETREKMLLGIWKLAELNVLDHCIKSSQRYIVLSFAGNCAGPASSTLTKVNYHGPAGVITCFRFGLGWQKTGRKGSLGTRAKVAAGTRAPGAYQNAHGLARWFTRCERYVKPGSV